MGIVAFNWAEGNNNQLTLLMNRDNWEYRVISGASWNGNGQILSGRSADNGGTWFGISRGGRVAFLVNIDTLLDHVDPNTGSELYPIKFLEGNMSPHDFGNYVAHRKEAGDLLSFSLIVADMTLNSMVHIRKLVKDPKIISKIVPFGVHTLSSYGGLDSTESPRDLHLLRLFNQMIGDLGNNHLPLEEISGRFMYNTEGGRFAVFHQTVMDHFRLGRQRVSTTSTTALVVKRTREVMLFERYMENGAWKTHDFDFNIQ